MKLQEAKDLIKETRIKKNRLKGFRVMFQCRTSSGRLDNDYFPDDDEPLLQTETEAWRLARDFAETNPNFFNIRVVDQNFRNTNPPENKINPFPVTVPSRINER